MKMESYEYVLGRFASLAISKQPNNLSVQIHFKTFLSSNDHVTKTYLNRVNKSVFFDIDLFAIGFNNFLIVF